MSQQVFRVDQMFVGLIVLGVMGFAADFLFERAVQRLFPWYGAEKESQRRNVGGDDGAVSSIRTKLPQQDGEIGEAA